MTTARQPTPTLASTPRPQIFGREPELAEIERFLDRAAIGSASLLIEGEPGIGKTTLWQAGLDLAGLRGWRVLRCQPVETEAALTLAAVTDLLGPVIDEVLDDLEPPPRRAIEVALLRIEAGAGVPDERALAVAVLHALAALAGSGPVLVAVDDLQWLDRASSEVLSYAVRRLGEAPVALMATVRDEHQVTELEQALPSEGLVRLALGPLASRPFGAMLRDRGVLDEHGPVALQLHEASRGNPFLGLELAGALEQGRALAAAEPLAVPATLARLVRRRLDDLDLPARDLVSVVAASPRATMALVAAVCGDTPATWAALDHAEDAGVLCVVDQEVRFAHPVLRTVAYGTATQRQRRRTHRRLADASADPEQRARHLALAASRPDEALAADLADAARRAHRRGAVVAACELADLALALTPPDRVAGRARRLVDAADLHFAAADPETAGDLLARAIEVTEPGPARARVRHRLARVTSSTSGASPTAELLELALAEAGDDPTLLAVLHRDLGLVLGNTPDGFPACLAHYDVALDQAEAAGAPALVAEMRAIQALAAFTVGQGVRRDLIDQALAFPDDPASPDDPADPGGVGGFDRGRIELRPRVVVSHVLEGGDDLLGARAALQAEHQASMARGAATDLPFVTARLAQIETALGDWEAAGHHVDEACGAAFASGASTQLAFAHAAGAGLAAARGLPGPTREHAGTAIGVGRQTGAYYPVLAATHALALLDLALGDPQGAVDRLAPAAAAMAERITPEPGFHAARFVPDLIEAQIRVGALDEAEPGLRAFEHRARATDRAWALALAGRNRALLAGADGDLATAAEALVGAFAAHQRLVMPFELARTHLVAAEVERRARHKRAARDQASQALALFDGLGSEGWSSRAGQERARAGLDPPNPDGLTAAETQVVRLVAAGQTNREVAAELAMGLRTVEAHLSRAYRKLGIRSRTELVRVWTDPDHAVFTDSPAGRRP